MLVFVRARRHTHRYARWYVAAVAGSIVYRAYVLCLTTDPHTPPLAGAIRGQPVGLAHSVLRRGELRGEPLEAVPASGGNESAQVVIVGAGVSGLVAAWELRKRGVTDVLVLEMDDAPGGNARSGYDGPGGIAYPWGAHYVPLPSRGATRMLLEELGLMRSAAADGADGVGGVAGVAGVAGVGADALCPEPSERLFVRGVGWRDAPDGLLPEAAMSEADWVQLRTFRSLVGQQARRQTADGRPPFVLPLAECSFDQEARALDGESMHEWMTRHGLSSTALRWFVEYATRDDYGATRNTPRTLPLALPLAPSNPHPNPNRTPSPQPPPLAPNPKPTPHP